MNAMYCFFLLWLALSVWARIWGVWSSFLSRGATCFPMWNMASSKIARVPGKWVHQALTLTTPFIMKWLHASSLPETAWKYFLYSHGLLSKGWKNEYVVLLKGCTEKNKTIWQYLRRWLCVADVAGNAGKVWWAACGQGQVASTWPTSMAPAQRCPTCPWCFHQWNDLGTTSYCIEWLLLDPHGTY